MNLEKLKEVLKINKQPVFRLRQIIKDIYQNSVSSFDEISTLPASLKEILKNEIAILAFEINKILISKDQRGIKALLKLTDGNMIETVLISLRPGIWSVCVSSQVGCPMNCLFCATGKGGFKRNLTAEEITDQVLFWRQYLKNRKSKAIINKLNNIVYMGMGEPFLNWDNVKNSLKILTDKDMFGFSSRGISISTCGIPDGIKKLAKEFPQVNLAISLHFADDKKRSEFMPINKAFDLEEIKNSLEKYFAATRRKVFIEYIMLAGENDNLHNAEKLAEYLKSIGNTHLLHVNLINYNATSAQFNPSPENKIQDFKNFLLKKRISVTVRKSLGEDIDGACGQLAGK